MSPPGLFTVLLLLAFPIAAILFVGSPAQATVYLNELTIRPAGASETVELYNSGPGAVDVGGWIIKGNKGTYTIPAPNPIPQGGYLALSVGDIQAENGGVTSLIDLILRGGSRSSGSDSVFYGQQGSAPLPPAGMSLARAPDASAGAPPPPDPALDGLVWTIDVSPTFGFVNDAPAPQMGQPFMINEFDPGNSDGSDMIEFYNPTGGILVAGGWLLMNGDAAMILNGLLPPFGCLVVTTPPSFDLGATGLLYLFTPEGTRVDQIGFHDAQPLGHDQCYLRCPDGASPHLGYDFSSSGGGSTFFLGPCTFGAPNGPGCVLGVEETPPRVFLRWGKVKALYSR